MEQPFFLLTLLLVFGFGILFGVVWLKSYGYIKYTHERKPPDDICYCDDEKATCDNDCPLYREIQMMQDAKGGDSK